MCLSQLSVPNICTQYRLARSFYSRGSGGAGYLLSCSGSWLLGGGAWLEPRYDHCKSHAPRKGRCHQPGKRSWSFLTLFCQLRCEQWVWGRELPGLLGCLLWTDHCNCPGRKGLHLNSPWGSNDKVMYGLWTELCPLQIHKLKPKHPTFGRAFS